MARQNTVNKPSGSKWVRLKLYLFERCRVSEVGKTLLPFAQTAMRQAVAAVVSVVVVEVEVVVAKDPSPRQA